MKWRGELLQATPNKNGVEMEHFKIPAKRVVQERPEFN